MFEVCAGCRLCFKYCGSFPTLFSLLDDEYDGDVSKLTRAETDSVVDLCFQCKLCEVQCPYTPRDGHAFQLDFPKLMHRHRAQRGRLHGFTLRERVMGDPDRTAAFARASLGLANVANKMPLQRWLMEKLLGIHRDKELPEFASTTFERWADGAGRIHEEPGGETVLFPTCTVNNNEPQIGRDTLEVFDKNEVECRCVRGLECCGMPAWEHGDLESLRQHAKANLDTLEPFVDAGAKVVVLQPTCSMMLRMEYPTLVAEEDRERAAKVAAAVVDPGEYLWSIRKEERFNQDFQSSPEGTITYHAPCHLRAQNLGYRSRDLLRLVADEVVLIEACSGVDGTWGMQARFHEASLKVAAKLLAEVDAAAPDHVATDCPLSALRIEEGTGRKAVHPIVLLRAAYGLGEP